MIAYVVMLLLLPCAYLNAQNTAIAVKGTVQDASGQRLIGVNIQVTGSRSGTTTNTDGNFSLNVPAGSTLLFTSSGFQPQSLRVTMPASNLSIIMTTDTLLLNQVVVVGYGTQQRKNVNTSVSTVRGDAISRQTVASVDQALQGQAPGIQVTSPTGQPGSGLNVQIRGNTSISLSNSPLYVIDGVPVIPMRDGIGAGSQQFNPMSTINPNDIESIDILKDGAAASIYGLRASNGVVVITTKRGKGKGQLSLNVYYGAQKLRDKIPVLNGPQWAELYNEALVNAGQAPRVTPADIVAATDWQDEIFRTAAMRNYQLSFSGSSDKTRYYLSGGFFDQDGIILNSGYKRYQFRLNLDQQLANKIRIGTNMNFSRSDDNRSVQSESNLNNGGVVSGSVAQIPILPIRRADGKYAINPYLALDNPIGNLMETHNIANIYQIIGNIYGEADILKNLTFRTNLGLDFRSQQSNNFRTLEYSALQDNAIRGSAEMQNLLSTIGLWENTLTYRPSLGTNNDLTILAGHSAQQSHYSNQYNSSTGFVSNDVKNFTAGSNINPGTSNEGRWGLVSFFGRAIYNYGNRYLLQASLRADGSSRFSKENRWGYFPAVALGWRISEESFFKSSSISNLKLRLSAGSNGNQEIDPYTRFTLFTPGQAGTELSQVGNQTLSWETTTQYNAGIDLGLINDRISVTLDVYKKTTKNLLLYVPLPAIAAFPGAFQNIGKVENRGIELGINTTNVRTSTWGWNTSFNFSLNRNKVLDLGRTFNEQGQEIDRTIIEDENITQKGLPLGAFYGYVTNGIFQTAAEVTAAATQASGTAPGDIRFADLGKDNVINASDRKVIGNPNPNFIAAITNNISYKNFELSFFFQGSFGNDIYNQTRVALESFTTPINSTTRALRRWKTSGDQTDVPRAVISDPNNNSRFSDRYIEDGTYVRLKNLTLSYSLPAATLSKARISNARFYITGQNLLTFTKYSGWDPEASATPQDAVGFGRDLGVYPVAVTVSAGINLTF